MKPAPSTTHLFASRAPAIGACWPGRQPGSPWRNPPHQRLRWERMHVAIRCGLHAERPGLLYAYLGLGRWLVRYAGVDDAEAQRRMLQLLLDTGNDPALPLSSRRACLLMAGRPLARLSALTASGALVHRAGMFRPD